MNVELQEAPPAERAVAGDGTSEKAELGGERYREPWPTIPQAIQFTGMHRSQVDGAAMGSWH